MKNKVVTLLVLSLLFAMIALIDRDYSKAALAMFIGSVCWPVAHSMISYISGGKDAR